MLFRSEVPTVGNASGLTSSHGDPELIWTVALVVTFALTDTVCDEEMVFAATLVNVSVVGDTVSVTLCAIAVSQSAAKTKTTNAQNRVIPIVFKAVRMALLGGTRLLTSNFAAKPRNNCY